MHVKPILRKCARCKRVNAGRNCLVVQVDISVQPNAIAAAVRVKHTQALWTVIQLSLREKDKPSVTAITGIADEHIAQYVVLYRLPERTA